MKKILIAFQLLGLYTFGQNPTTIYIDPDFTGNGNGTINQPFNDWDNDVTMTSYTTYLQKRGTEINNIDPIVIENKENIIIGAYGNGDLPKINYYGANSDVISVLASSHCIISDLEIEGNIHQTTAGVHFGGYWTGSRPANNNKVDNCIIHDVYNGVRGLPYNTNLDTIRIWNSTIYNCMSDGIFVGGADSMSIINTSIYRVNMGWHLMENGHSQFVSAGDCIQLAGDCNSFLVKNCILDRSYTGNKFCFIYNTGGASYTGSGEITGTTFYPPKDTLGDDGGSCLYLKRGSYMKVSHNRFYGKNFPEGENPGSLAHCEIDVVDFYYNLIDNVSNFNIGLSTHMLNLSNNTFITPDETGNVINLNGDSCMARNNIFALAPGMEAIYNNSGGLINQTNTISFGNYGNNPGFVNFEAGDYTLKAGSPCVDSGTGYAGWPYDLDNNSIQNTRDKGAYEYNDGSQSTNEPPLINNQSFSLPENSPATTIVGMVLATDPNAGQNLIFEIISGNTNNTFAINPANGQITVALTNGLNFENIDLYNLVVEVTDDDINPLSASASVLINLLDINEPPLFPNQNFTITENAPNGAWVGNVQAMDPDAGQSVTFMLQGGNLGNVFVLNPVNGQLSVSNNIFLDYESVPVFDLIIKVEDNSLEHLSITNHLIIQLVNINDIPLIIPAQFSIEENSENGSLVGTVSAFDQDTGQLLSFSIVSGNLGGTFQIGTSSGEVLVNDNVFLNYESVPTFDLLVRVTDNGPGMLFNEAIIHIILGDANDPPIIINQQFTLIENSPVGFIIGDVFAFDPDASDQPLLSILNGNLGNTFSINPISGQLSVNDNAFLNFEGIPVFELIVKAEDSELLASYASVIISLLDVNDPPIITYQSFSVPEYSSAGYNVGFIQAFDPDSGQQLQYELLSGNLGETFQLNEVTGELTVHDNVFLDPDLIPFFDLTIKVRDNGLLNLSSQAIARIYVLNTNNQPAALTSDNDTFEPNVFIESSPISNSIKLYPNPTSGSLNIQLQDHEIRQIRIRILDMSGTIYRDQFVKFSNINASLKLELFDLPNGIYLVQLFNDSFSQTEKLIVR